MGLFDRLSKIADTAAEKLNAATDKIAKAYEKEGFNGVVDKAADSITKVARDAAKATASAADSIYKSIDDKVKEREITYPKARDLFLNEGQIAELNAMPLSLLLKNLNARANVDGQKDKYKLHNASILLKEQNWYDFNNAKGGRGAVSLLNHEVRLSCGLVNNVDAKISKDLLDVTFAKLVEISEKSEYKTDLSNWIKEEINKQPKKAAPVVEIVETAPVIEKVKRVRKPTVKVDVPEVEVKSAVKKTIKAESKETVKKESPKTTKVKAIVVAEEEKVAKKSPRAKTKKEESSVEEKPTKKKAKP